LANAINLAVGSENPKVISDIHNGKNVTKILKQEKKKDAVDEHSASATTIKKVCKMNVYIYLIYTHCIYIEKKK
jgi:hypothetical protein